MSPKGEVLQVFKIDASAELKDRKSLELQPGDVVAVPERDF